MEDSVDEFVINAKQIEVLRENADRIEERFSILITLSTSVEDDNVWVKLRGKLPNVQKSKVFIKALCNPEHQESIILRNFPHCIATALQRFWFSWLEYLYGAYIKDGTHNFEYVVQGSQMNVTKVISVLLHLKESCLKDMSDTTHVIKFDTIIRQCEDPQEKDLLGMKSAIKKDLLQMMTESGKQFNAGKIRRMNKVRPLSGEKSKKSSILSSVFSSDNVGPAHQTASDSQPTGRSSKPIGRRGSAISPSAQEKKTEPSSPILQRDVFRHDHLDSFLGKNYVPFDDGPRSKAKCAATFPNAGTDRKNSLKEEVGAIVISDEDMDDSVIFVSETRPPDGSHDHESDHEVAEKSKRPALPQTMVIETWMEVNYEITDSENDCVYKSEMLAEFRRHFNLPDHPELSNEFFSKISQAIFERDPNYAKVKSKGASGKTAKRRLVCLKKRARPASPHPPLPRSTPPPSLSSSSRGILKTWVLNDAPIKRESDPAPSKPPPKAAPRRRGSPSPVPAQADPAPINEPPDSPMSDKSNVPTRDILDLPKIKEKPNLRPIVIDGSNVACAHGNGKTFSCRGLAICVSHFWKRGHRDITCLIPNFRKGTGGNPPISEQFVLFDLEKKNIAKFTPSRLVNGNYQVCYDDRFILDLAAIKRGVVVSNDQYRDLRGENPKWADVIDNRLLQYTYVGDIFMLPEDPLGRHGPKLAEFLSLGRGQNSAAHGTARRLVDERMMMMQPPIRHHPPPRLLRPRHPPLNFVQPPYPHPIQRGQPQPAMPPLPAGKKRKASLSLPVGLAKRKRSRKRAKGSKKGARKRKASAKKESAHSSNAKPAKVGGAQKSAAKKKAVKVEKKSAAPKRVKVKVKSE